jgi:hypothetical protein
MTHSNTGLDDIHLADGLYYHTAMLDGTANQLTEMISPALIFSQLYHVYKNASKRFYIVDNVSDLYPCILTAAARAAFSQTFSDSHDSDHCTHTSCMFAAL